MAIVGKPGAYIAACDICGTRSERIGSAWRTKEQAREAALFEFRCFRGDYHVCEPCAAAKRLTGLGEIAGLMQKEW